ncbi:MAG: alpha/beta hydrolase, partial [Pyrinomonadaceae bacterium]
GYASTVGSEAQLLRLREMRLDGKAEPFRTSGGTAADGLDNSRRGHRPRFPRTQRLSLCVLTICLTLLLLPSSLSAQTTQGTTASPSSQTKNSAAGRIEYGEFASESLGRKVRYGISLPPSYDKDPSRRFPVVVFLHGLNNDERDWETHCMEGKVEALRAAGKIGEFIVAAPYGANSFYLNGKDGTRYEDAIVRDFLPFVDHTYRTISKPETRLIEGISMGGYGALLIAFKHPELFAGVAAHSAALFDELPQASATDRAAGYRYALAIKLFGEPPDAEYFRANNPLYLARQNAARLKRLKIYFDVGDADRYGFAAGNARLARELTAAGVAHTYTLAPGGHGWAFLVDRGEPALTFVWQTLRPRP